MHVSVFKNGFHHYAGAFNSGEKCHELRLHIRRKAGVRHSFNICGDQGLHIGLHPYEVVAFLDVHTAFYELCDDRLYVIGHHVFYQDITSCNSCGHHESARFNPVGYDCVPRSVERGNAFDTNGIGTRAFHLRAHFIHEVCKVDDFRLLCRVFYYCVAFGECCGHHDVFRGSDAGKIQVDLSSCQLIGSRFHITVSLLDFCSQSLESFEMKIDRSGANSTASRQCDLRSAGFCQERSHNQYGCPHSFD